MSERALILGSGQDASFLADILLGKGWAVHLLHRRSSSPDHLWRLARCRDRLTLHEGDVLDTESVARVIRQVKPAWCLNEADQDNIDYSLKTPGYSADVTFGAVVRLLEAVRQIDPAIRWFQPLSITMFGDHPPPQNEGTPLKPMSPYSVAKAAAWLACRHYRRERGLFVSCGILGSHDSARRGRGYLLQTIARQAVEVARGQREAVLVGNPDAVVDVGCAREYMEAAVGIMSLPRPDDFVIGTGWPYTADALAGGALIRAGVKGAADFVRRDPSFSRPGRTPRYLADYSKLTGATGWKPRKAAMDVVCGLVDHLMGRA